MHYMEDYLDGTVLHHLPGETRKRLIDMQKTDILIQSKTAKTNKLASALDRNGKKMSVKEWKAEYSNISNSYYELLKESDWQVHQSTALYGDVNKYLQYMDMELHKLKMELEADSPGITEIIEKRDYISSLAEAAPVPPQRKPNKKRRYNSK